MLSGKKQEGDHNVCQQTLNITQKQDTFLQNSRAMQAACKEVFPDP
jgi:hypothetical protein